MGSWKEYRSEAFAVAYSVEMMGFLLAPMLVSDEVG
jgi:hypothetical protein